MELEAYSDDHIATVLAWIRAQRHLAERYLRGELNADEDEDVDRSEEEEKEEEEKGARAAPASCA